LSPRSRREIVGRVAARRDETTSTGPADEASALSASSRRFTASSNAGGRSRNETLTSANTYVGGSPASHNRRSSAKRSGPGTRMRTDLRRAAIALVIEPATIGHAGRGSLATSSSAEARVIHSASL